MPIDTSWIDDPSVWAEVRGVLVPLVERKFSEAFILGAEMGAMQQPAPERGRRALISPMEDMLARLEHGVRQLDPSLDTILPFDFEATLSASQEVIANYTDDWWEQFSESTRRQMRRIIARAEAQGLTTAQVAEQLAPLFGETRAMTIAVSELTDLMGMGAQETYRRAGFGEWEWRTVRDSKVDPECKERDRKRYPMSVKFRRAHVRCRCWPVPAGRPALQTSFGLLSA